MRRRRRQEGRKRGQHENGEKIQEDKERTRKGMSWNARETQKEEERSREGRKRKTSRGGRGEQRG